VTIKEQLEHLQRNTTNLISSQELESKLKKGVPLRVKLGVDPTVGDVTLGWAVVLRKLRDFQQLGHTACLIIGDFTTLIGDPSGKSKTRPQLTRAQVEKNVLNVMSQFYKILDKDKTEIYYNSDWLGKMSFEDVIKLAAKYTVARMFERDDFSKRLKEEQPIAMHEILYPLCQGYDSVAVKADVELGGNDQLFNNLVGRNLMSHFGLEPQIVMLSPLLIGTDGKEKMSQSLGNYISIIDSPKDMFGKTMSIPDELIENWLDLTTDIAPSEISELVSAMKGGELNPRDVKMRLGREIVGLYHGVVEAQQAEDYFIQTFSNRLQPEDVPMLSIPSDFSDLMNISLASLMATLGLTKSNSEARRLMQSGAVSLEGDKITDLASTFSAEYLNGKVLRVGKKQFCRLVINS
jgi:tyrosyl-tRNA synthetase